MSLFLQQLFLFNLGICWDRKITGQSQSTHCYSQIFPLAQDSLGIYF